MHTKEKKDLRVIKTEKAIKKAFKEMICQMDSSQITIKELAERAMIHRKTFYLHYSCIEELYEELLAELAEDYFKEIDKLSENATFKEVNHVFFTFMAQQETYMERIVCSDSYKIYANKFFISMLKHNRNNCNPYKKFSQAEQNIINTFLGVSSANIYRQWVADEKTLSLEKLIELSGNLFMQGISSIL